jgi:hypothetical protein
MSLREKRRQLDEKYPIHNFRYVPKQLGVFGQDAKSITIGTLRRRIVQLEATPGPGQYSVMANGPPDFQKHVIQNRPEVDYRSISRNVDFSPLTPFARPKTRIGELDGRSYFILPETPAPIYMPRYCQSSIAPSIKPRFTQREVSDVPGPGAYEPYRPSTVSFTMPRAQVRGFWESDTQIPGPGKYDTAHIPKVPKKWAEKLRVSAEVVYRQSRRERAQLQAKMPKKQKPKNDFYPTYCPMKC